MGRAFESCTSDSDCGASGTCALAFAGGLCTYECMTHAACGPLGICANDRCYPACGNAQAGLGCDNFPHTSTPCRQYSETRSYCTPACDPTPEGGEPACVASTTCDPYSADWRNGACVTTPVTEGAENGEPCFQGANCRSGRCFPAKYESGTPTGWPDGACLSYGVQPSDAEYEAAVGGPMPTGSCPEGSAPFRTNGPGNETTCYASCASSADCRQGYNCSFLSGGNYTTGVCFPMGQ